MSRRTRPYSRFVMEGLALLAKQIRLARKQRRMSTSELAARVGIARSTLQLIEKGSPSVEIGVVFEAAVIVGINLFEFDRASITSRIAQIDEKLALLPKYARRPRGAVNDDF